MLLGGAVADRVDRRRILLISNTLQMVLAAALGLLYVTGHLGIVPILVIAALTGLTQSQSAPTYQAVITSLVPPRQIQNAVALNSLQFNLSRAIGPAVAGLLLARAGTGACFAVNAISFLAVIVAADAGSICRPRARRKGTLGESLLAGLRHVAHDPLLSSLTLLGAAGALLAFPLITYLPVIAGDVLKTGVGGFSALLSSFGAGAIAGALATAQRGHVPHRGRIMLLALLVYGAAVAAAMASRIQLVSMALLFVAGASLVTALLHLELAGAGERARGPQGPDPQHLGPGVPQRHAARRSSRGRDGALAGRPARPRRLLRPSRAARARQPGLEPPRS